MVMFITISRASGMRYAARKKKHRYAEKGKRALGSNVFVYIMLASVGALYVVCCVLVVRAFVFIPGDKVSRRVAVMGAGAFALSVIGCLAVSDLAGEAPAALFAALSLAAMPASAWPLSRRWRRVEREAGAAVEKAREQVAQANERKPLDNSELCAFLARAYDLTRREEEVVTLLLDGCTQAKLPTALCVSENTVKTHVRHIYRKLGIRSRDELTERAEALRNGRRL